MHLAENFRQAYISLTTNKLRSLLTMLGIVMGVFSVVAIMAISNATKVYMTNELNKMGARTVNISINDRDDDLPERAYLKMDDLDRIQEGVDGIDHVAGVSVFYSDMRVEGGTRFAIIQSVSNAYKEFQQINIVRGRFISEEDVAGNRRVIVVPDTYAMEYYETLDILGEEVTLYNYYGDVMKYRVIGVRSTEGDLFASLLDSIDYPVEVMIPIATGQKFFGFDRLDQVSVSVSATQDLKMTGEKIVRLLNFTHRTEDSYLATSVEQIQQSVGGILNVISMILLVIAIITLVVGGIGIINILLVSVTERIREIGLRKAIGAKKRDIVLQFLTESVMMTGFSGIIGIALGLIAGMIISNVINIPPIVDVQTAALAFMGSVVLGLIFGVYPAMRAADLDPIESLRYE